MSGATSGSYACPACGTVNDSDVAASLWCNTPFGLAVLRPCRTQKCARLALEARADDGWKLRRGNLPPFKTPEERAAHLARRGDG